MNAMTNEEFAELRARKKVDFERLMNPKGVPYLETATAART